MNDLPTDAETEELRAEITVLKQVMWEAPDRFTRTDLRRELSGNLLSSEAIDTAIGKLVRVGLLHEQNELLVPTRQAGYMARLVEFGGW